MQEVTKMANDHIADDRKKVRLIDANALLEDFGEEPLVWNDGEAEIQERSDWHRYRVLVKIQPTVDAVEVVRCKDCKHFNHQKALRPGGIWCEYWGTDPDPDDFCSYGERRTE
jgi:hypothetical protein